MKQSFDAAGGQNGIFSSVWGASLREGASGAPNLSDALSHDADIVTQQQFEAR
jgi:hypothetical protein